MAKTDTPVSFAPSTRVMLFVPNTGQWLPTTFKQAKSANEFTLNGKLYRVVESGKAKVVPNVDVGKPPEADRPFGIVYRRPGAGDVVQVLSKDMRFVAHEALSKVQPGARIRFQGRAYDVAADRSLVDTGITFPAVTGTRQPIEITKSAWQHILDRHTVGGKMNAGKSTFKRGENIQALTERRSDRFVPARFARRRLHLRSVH